MMRRITQPSLATLLVVLGCVRIIVDVILAAFTHP
jgi:membrane-bound ClpP family serine protease